MDRVTEAYHPQPLSEIKTFRVQGHHFYCVIWPLTYKYTDILRRLTPLQSLSHGPYAK